MRDNGLYHRYNRKYVKATGSEQRLSYADNLLDSRFDEFGINPAGAYIPTKKDGFIGSASLI